MTSVQSFSDAEAKVIAAPLRRGIRGATTRRALHIRVAQERAITKHAIRAVAFLVRTAVSRGVRTIGFVTILHPLEDVAVHVVQPEGVRRERADGRGSIDPHVPP